MVDSQLVSAAKTAEKRGNRRRQQQTWTQPKAKNDGGQTAAAAKAPREPRATASQQKPQGTATAPPKPANSIKPPTGNMVLDDIGLVDGTGVGVTVIRHIDTARGTNSKTQFRTGAKVYDKRNGAQAARRLTSEVPGITVPTNDSSAKRLTMQDEAAAAAAKQNERDLEDHLTKLDACKQKWDQAHPGDYKPPTISYGAVDVNQAEWKRCDPKAIYQKKDFTSITEPELANVVFAIMMERHRDTETCKRLLQMPLPWAKKRGGVHANKTVLWGAMVVLHLLLLINKKTLTAGMSKSTKFTVTTRPEQTIKKMRLTACSWLVQTFFFDPTAKQKDMRLIGSWKAKDRDYFEQIILPFMDGVCSYWKPADGEGWNVRDLCDKTVGNNFRKDVHKRIKEGVWSIEEVNSLPHTTMDNVDVKRIMDCLWYEFAVLCMYCMNDFLSFRTDNEATAKYFCTRFQNSDAFWSDMEKMALFHTGGDDIAATLAAGYGRGSVYSNGAFHEYEGGKTAENGTVGMTKRSRKRRQQEATTSEEQKEEKDVGENGNKKM